MLEYNVTDIEWEVDEGYDISDLPTEVNVLVPDTEDIDVDEFICEYLSDEYECLVKSYCFEEVDEN